MKKQNGARNLLMANQMSIDAFVVKKQFFANKHPSADDRQLNEMTAKYFSALAQRKNKK